MGKIAALISKFKVKVRPLFPRGEPLIFRGTPISERKMPPQASAGEILLYSCHTLKCSIEAAAPFGLRVSAGFCISL
jgi:hypothetical protein